MTAVPLPMKVDTKPARAPKRVPAGKTRPAWSDYRVKTPVHCDHCVLVAYESAMDGKWELASSLRSARRKRRQDGENLLLCNEHAQIQYAQDQIDFPAGESQTGRTSNAGQKYIA